jgi:hypothetical protein
MSPWAPRCPRCQSLDVEEYHEVQEASDRSENFVSTHRCKNERCHWPFKDTPPTVTTKDGDGT